MSFKPTKDREFGSTAQVVSRLFAEAGGVDAVMGLLQLSRTRVYALADPHDKAELSLSRAATLTSATGATAVAEHFALLAGGAFLPLDAGAQTDWHTLAGLSAEQSATMVAELMRSLGPSSRTPGRLDVAEARELLETVETLMRSLAAKRSMLLAASQSEE